MKEIKAYIRREKAEYVISELEKAGVPGCTAVVVKGVGAAAVPEEEYLSIDYINGMVFVSDINYALKIRTGETGDAALVSKPDTKRKKKV